MFKKNQVLNAKFLEELGCLICPRKKSYMEIVHDFCPVKAELRLPPYFHQSLELCSALSANCLPQSTNQRPIPHWTHPGTPECDGKS